MWFELRISGREHVSREWATGNRIIILHSRETQEGPWAGNRATGILFLVSLTDAPLYFERSPSSPGHGTRDVVKGEPA